MPASGAGSTCLVMLANASIQDATPLSGYCAAPAGLRSLRGPIGSPRLDIAFALLAPNLRHPVCAVMH